MVSGSPSSAPPWHILLIDDDEDDFVVTRQIFSSLQHRKVQLDWANTYKAGREKILLNPYDAVLLDYDLGVKNGLDLVREVRALGYTTPLIILTGQGSYEVDVQAMQAGASDYLSKRDISASLLERSIRYAIEVRRSQQARELSQNKLALLLQISEEILKTDSLKSLCSLALEAACDLTGARLGTIGHGFTPETAQVQTLSIANGLPLPESQASIDSPRGGVYSDLLYRTPYLRLTQTELASHSAWWGLPDEHPPLNGLLGARLVGSDEQPAGVIMVSDRYEGEFNDEDMRLLSQLAALTSLMMQQMETHQAAEQAAEDAYISAEHAWRTAAELEAVLSALPVAVWLADESGKVTRSNSHTRALWGEADPARLLSYTLRHPETHDPISPDEWPLSQAIRSGIPASGVEVEIVRFDGSIGSILVSASPIKDNEGNIIGGVGVAMDITDLRSLQAQQIERETRLEVQRHLTRQREMERIEISRDLHDGPLQDLISSSFLLSQTLAGAEGTQKEDLLAVREAVQAGIDSLRAFCNELRPPALAPFGLERALRSHLSAFSARYPSLNIQADLDPDGQLLPEELRLALFRICQELLNNAARHSQAEQISVTLKLSDKRISLEVSDNGIGFTPPTNWLQLLRQGHLGLVGLRERAEAAGGVLKLQSKPGEGTKISVTVPLG